MLFAFYSLNYANVKMYGAFGDGISDDTEAIEAALSSGKDTIYFPEGTYLVNNAQFQLEDGKNLIGKDAVLTGTAAQRKDQHNSIFFINGNCKISGLSFQINMDSETINYHVGCIWVNGGARNIEINDCEFVCSSRGNYNLFGIRMYEKNISHIYVKNCYGKTVNFLGNNVSGPDCCSYIYCDNNILEDCINGFGFNNPTDSGNTGDSAHDIYITNNTIEITDTPVGTCFAVDFAGTSNIYIKKNILTPGNYNYSQCIHIEDDCENVSIEGNTLILPKDYNEVNSWLVSLSSVENVTVEDNILRNESTENQKVRGIMVGEYKEETTRTNNITILNNNFNNLGGGIEIGVATDKCIIKDNSFINCGNILESLYSGDIYYINNFSKNCDNDFKINTQRSSFYKE